MNSAAALTDWTQALEENVVATVDAYQRVRDMLELVECAGVFACAAVDIVLRSLRALKDHISCAESCETEHDFFVNARLAKAECKVLCLALFPAIQVVKRRLDSQEEGIPELLEALRDLRSESRFLDEEINGMLEGSA